jgi:NitT/TauT family transport system permease protein
MAEVADRPLASPAPRIAAPTTALPKKRRRSRTGWLLPVGTILALFLIWEAAVRVFKVPVYLLPAPSQILGAAYFQRDYLFKNAMATSYAILLGFGAAVLVGIPIAAAMTYSGRFSRAIYPVLLTVQVLPKVALAPLFIVWFGFGLMPKVVMTFLIAFFPIVIDSLAGLASVRLESLMLLRSMGASRWQAFWKVRMPIALPHVFSGLKIGMTFAVVGAIVAEFVASDSGLGFVLVDARANLDMVLVFAAILWLIALGFVFYVAVELAERLFVQKTRRHRGHELGAGL